MRPCGDFRPTLVRNHTGVTVISHLFHVGFEGAAASMRHNVGRVDEKFVSRALYLGVQHHVFCTNATFLKESHFSKVGHAMGAIDSGVVRDWNEFSLGLGAIACSCGHEFRTKGDVGTFCTEWVVVWCKIWSTDSTDFGVVKPANEFLNPVQRRNGIVVGEEDEVVVHLIECEITGVGSVA